MHFLITRPQTQADSLQTELQKMGHKVLLAPLLEIVLEKTPLDLTGLQAIIVTSQNGVRALLAHPNFQAILKLPLVVVGSGTAAIARQEGFQILFEGKAGGAELAEDIKALLQPKKGDLLHASGDVVALDFEKELGSFSFIVHRRIVYRTVTAKNLPKQTIDALFHQTLDGVLLMSPRTSQVWSDLVVGSGLKEKTHNLTHFCLSEAVAAPLQKLNKVPIKVAPMPNLKDFLALFEGLPTSLPS